MPMESLAEIQRRFSNAPVRIVYGRALRLAHGIDHDHQALVPAGGEYAPGGVSQMVLDMVYALRGKAGQVLPTPIREGLPARRRRGTTPPKPGRANRAGCAANSRKSVRSRLRPRWRFRPRRDSSRWREWKIARVLFQTEPLFGRGCQDLSVRDQRRGRIVPLGYPVFALV